MELNMQLFSENVKKSERPVVIDFWATWCPPCRMQTPIFEDVEKQYSDRADFYKVDVDNQNELAEMFSIVNIPTIVVMNKGIVVEKREGLASKEILIGLIEKAENI